MAVTTLASGTITATSTAQTLSGAAAAGCELLIDTSALTAGDGIRVQVLMPVLSGGTALSVQSIDLVGPASATDPVIKRPLGILPAGWSCTVLLIGGTGRATDVAIVGIV